MSKISKLSADIPPSEYEFDVQFKGKYTRKAYSGRFKGKIPNTRDRVKADIVRAKLSGGADEDQLDPSVLLINKMYSYLSVALTEYPDWWQKSAYGYDLIDGNAITEVYKAQQLCEMEWLKAIWGEELEDSDEEEEKA